MEENQDKITFKEKYWDNGQLHGEQLDYWDNDQLRYIPIP